MSGRTLSSLIHRRHTAKTHTTMMASLTSQCTPLQITCGTRLARNNLQKQVIRTRTAICRSEPENNRLNSGEQETPKASTPESVNEEPIWVRRERERELLKKEGSDLPFGVYLLASAIVAIAAVGSIFEYVNKNPIFDVIDPDSPLYVPILGLFAVTGFPSSAFLFYRAVTAANKEAERMDKLDGY